MWLRALLIASLLCCAYAGNITADVRSFIVNFQQLNQTGDVVDALDRIGETTKDLFKIGRPLGELLLNFNATGNATKEEVAALLELNKLFKTISADIRSRLNDIPISMDHHSYVDVAIAPSHSLLSYLELLTNTATRTASGSEYANHFRYLSSRSAFDPLKAIDTIDITTRIGCHMPTKVGIKWIIKLHQALSGLEHFGGSKHKWTDEEKKSFDEMAKDILVNVRSQKDEEYIANFKRAIVNLISNSNSTEVMEALHEMQLDSYAKSSEATLGHRCILEQVIETYPLNETALFKTLTVVHRDLQRIALLSWTVTSMTETEEKYYSTDMEIAALTLARSGRFLAKWTKHVQEIVWPEIAVESAKIAIENIKSPLNALNQTAMLLNFQFQALGAIGYDYHILVVPTSEVDVSWSVDNVVKEDYVNITACNGLDVHVFRFNSIEAEERSAKAKKWIEAKKEDLLKRMRHGALATTKALLKQLNKDFSTRPAISKNFYRSMILLRKKQSLTSESGLTVGHYHSTQQPFSYELELTTSSFSAIDHGRETTYTWKAFFFV